MADASQVRARTLVLVRHAKSDWPLGVPDHDRPLADRGRRDAPAAGRWVAAEVGAVDLALVSTALRTQQSWALMRDEIDYAEQRDEPRVYEASWHELLEVVEGIPDDVTIVLVLGHNPGMEELAERLSGDADPAAAAQLRQKFPTSAIAVIEVRGPWSAIAQDARLVAMAVPRG